MLQAPVILTLVGLAAFPLGPVWQESTDGGGDAGSTGGTAQQTKGSGTLMRIVGGTGGASAGVDLEDMYVIRVCDPLAFLAATGPDGGGLADFDTQLWLFKPISSNILTIRGLLANDDVAPGQPPSFLPPVSNDGSGAALVDPGIYFLAISGFDRDPVNLNGLIFDQATRTEVSGPDGEGGPFPHQAWITFGDADVGFYEIALFGTSYANLDLPEDCDGNGLSDACEIYFDPALDANGNRILDACECVADLDGSGTVGFDDLLALLGQWGPCDRCAADLDGDHLVGFNDLLLLLGAWGPCGG